MSKGLIKSETMKALNNCKTYSDLLLFLMECERTHDLSVELLNKAKAKMHKIDKAFFIN